MSEFKIILEPIDKDKEKLIIRKQLNESSNKILAKAIVFIYLNQPCNCGELIDKISSHYKVPLSRGSSYYAINMLYKLNLIKQETYADAILFNNKIHNKIINKHKEFLRKIPESLRRRYANVSYNYLTDFGEEFIEFCCKVLEIKCIKEEINYEDTKNKDKKNTKKTSKNIKEII